MKIPPHSIETEQWILGAMITSPQARKHCHVELSESDFYRESHQLIFRAISPNVETDLLGVVAELEKQGNLERAGGTPYLMEIAAGVTTTVGLDFHIAHLRDLACRRQLIQAAATLADQAQDLNLAVEDIASEATKTLDDILEQVPSENPVLPVEDGADLLAREFPYQGDIIKRAILPAGGGLILAGEGGVGKSLLRTQIALCIAMGWDIFGWEVPEARKVLIVQFENPEHTEQNRLYKILQAYKTPQLPSGRLIFSDPRETFDLQKKNDCRRAQELIRAANVDVVIYDPLISLHTANENDNPAMRAVLDEITQLNRQCGVASIVIHHFGKPQEDRQDRYRYRGASAIWDWADTFLNLTRRYHEDYYVLFLEATKVRHGPIPKPIYLIRDPITLHHSPAPQYVVDEIKAAAKKKGWQDKV